MLGDELERAKILCVWACLEHREGEGGTAAAALAEAQKIAETLAVPPTSDLAVKIRQAEETLRQGES